MSTSTLPAEPKRLIGYFPSWAIHAQNYHVADIPAGQLTHVIYAFANVDASGNCLSVSPNDDGINFPQLRQLKQQHPELQISISVGGASNSSNFPDAASTDAARAHFAQSCVQFMKANGFDGVDIDWEYPAASDAKNLTALLMELRRQIDAAAAADKRTYLLTVVGPAGSEHYANFELASVQASVDWINLEAYDFSVASSSLTDFVAPLRPYDPSIARHAASTVDAAVQAYLKAGVPASKLVMGTRLIGTGWQGVVNADNGLYKNHNGPAKGTWDAAGAAPTGSFGYQDVTQNHVKSATRFWHAAAEVPWIFDPATGIMISYEDPQSLLLKAAYILTNALAGVMIWDLSADDAAHSLLNTLADGLGQASNLTTYTVTGQVTSPDSASIGGLLVQLVDKTIGADVPLGVTTTDATGRYRISVNISTTTIQSRLKSQPDFQTRVSIGQTFLAASDIRYNASTNETLNVSLPANLSVLASEFETLSGAIGVNYSGKVGDLNEDDERQDITYLANKTGWDARAVAMAALAEQFSRLTAQTSGPAPATVSLKQEFYYALFRAGLPANADGLFQASPNTVQAIWAQTIKQGVIPQALANEAAAALTTYQSLSAAHTLVASPVVGISTLSQMLQASLPEAAQQQTFSSLYVQHRDDLTTFWSELQKSLGVAKTAELQLRGQLHYLALNNEPLVAALLAAESQKPLASTLDLVSRGYYDPAKWTGLIGAQIPVPKQIPGSGDQQRANYAELLATQVRLAFPTAVVGDLVQRGAFPLSDKSAQATDVAAFLTSNQDAYQIGVEPVEAFLARMKSAGTPVTVTAAVVQQVKRLQRVYQLTQDDQSMSALLQHRLDSAYAIAGWGASAFVRAFQDKLTGGAAAAAQIHTRAQQIHGAVLNIAITYLKARSAPAIGGVAPVLGPYIPPAQASTPSIIAYPTLEQLFGSLDYCNCPDCRAILSPAAYLVDLLYYLDKAPPALDTLLARRPDLQYLPLTCANTNTALPYIDIINETLEYFVANSMSLAGYQGHDTNSSVTSAELLASPQYVDDRAYATLEGAFHPPPLPFNRPLELLRLHLQKIGAALPDVMLALRANDALDRGTGAYGWRDILMEQAEISREEYLLFTNGASVNLGALYGYAAAVDAYGALKNIDLETYSQRTGVSYDDLFSIVKTQFVNPNAILIERLQQLDIPFSALQTLSDPATAARFKLSLPLGLRPIDYGGSSSDAIVNWAIKNAPTLGKIITITPNANATPGGGSGQTDLCSGQNLQFKYFDLTPLTATDFFKMMRFIRLWQKLNLSIDQTDAILAALYPPEDLPTGAGDAADLANLDAGFTKLLARLGFLLQVMERLNLTPNADLDQLLACWSPIGSVGDNSLYTRLFLTPAVLQQDPGAQTATVSGPISFNDILTTTINGVQIAVPVRIGNTVDNLPTAIANRINGTATIDPVSRTPLGQRFFAAPSAKSTGVVVIQAGFQLSVKWSSGATENVAVTTTNPTLQSATVGGVAKPGDVITTTINGFSIPYVVTSQDTIPTIAANVAAAVNATTALDPFSNLPLSNLVVASVSGAQITFQSGNAGVPFSLACSSTLANQSGFSVGILKATNYTAAVSGTIAAGDVLSLDINSVSVIYTVAVGDTPLTIASKWAAIINTATTIVKASSIGTNLLIFAQAPTTTFSIAASVTKGAETLEVSGPFPETQSLSVSGAFPAGAVLTTKINGVAVPYVVVAGDNPGTIAQNIATAINAASALNSLVSADVIPSSGGATSVEIIVSAFDPATTLGVTASIDAGLYTAGRLPSVFADDGSGKFLSDPSQLLLNHEPALCAAFNLTGAEFAVIISTLNFNVSTQLTLENVSAIFRIGWLAHKMGMSVVVFLQLRAATGLDPVLFPSPSPATSLDLAPGAPEPPVILFIRLYQALLATNLKPEQALYVIWNQDLSGRSGPTASDIGNLAVALRGDFAAVETQFVLKDDPDGTIAKTLMALVYGTDATDFFFGLLNNTFVTSAAYLSAQSALPQPVVNASGGRLGYDNLRKQLSFSGYLDDQTKAAIQVAATGDPNLQQSLEKLATANKQAIGPFFSTFPELQALYLTYVASSDPLPTRRNALLAVMLPTLKQKRKQEQALATVTSASGSDPSFAAALLQDATVIHAANDPSAPAIADLTAIESQGLSAQFFFSSNPSPDVAADAQGPSLSYAQTATIGGGSIKVNDVLTTTINGTAIPYKVLATDTSLALLASSIAGAINAASPINQSVSAQAAGPVITIGGVDPSGANSSFTLVCSTSAGATETYVVGTQLPAAPSGGAINQAIWSGYVTAPQSGYFDIAVATDAGAKVALTIDGDDAQMAQVVAGAGLWSNQTAIALSAGTLVPIVLTVTSLKSSLSVSWRSVGIGWQSIPNQYLYSATFMSRLGATYLRFLKATSLATGLSLNANEIGWLGTAGSSRINTSDNKDNSPAGATIFSPQSMTNISVGSSLIVDAGASQETIVVTATTATTFAATTTKPHNGAANVFPIVAQALPTIGQGWLNFLAGAPASSSTTTASELRLILSALLAFARIKAALAPGDERLMAFMSNPTQPALRSLTGWSLTSVTALLQQFSGSAQLSWLSQVENFRRVYDAYAVVKSCRISAQTLISATTNDPSPAAVSALQSALRALYAQSDWLTVVRPISDAMRIKQRDSLVAYVLQKLSDSGSDVNTADKLFEYFLMDVETQPPVETSRIRLALSSVQLFIERVFRSLEEPQLSPSLLDASLWTWMKRYRVWQANREVFLWPENWLYPELRDDESPFFQQMMSALLQSDITDDAAANAYLDYLTNLESVAKLEPCGIYYAPSSDPGGISYVVARTAGAHRKHYFRKLELSSWSPWTEVKIDCEDMPLTPIVWNDRLFLFWLKVLKQAPQDTSQAGSFIPDNGSGNDVPLSSLHLSSLKSEVQKAATPSNQRIDIYGVLCWSEFYNGKWQPTKTSDVNRPSYLGSYPAIGETSFDVDRNLWRIEPDISGDVLVIGIYSSISGVPFTQFFPFSNGFDSGFVLHNTHSLPVRLQDAINMFDGTFFEPPGLYQWPQPVRPYTGGGDLGGTIFSMEYLQQGSGVGLSWSIFVQNQILSSGKNWRYLGPQLSAGWYAPLFFEDTRNLFYVTTTEKRVPVGRYSGFGVSYSISNAQGSGQKVPGLVFPLRPAPSLSVDPVLTYDGGGPAIVEAYLSQSTRIRAGIGSSFSVSYEGKQIALSGSAPKTSSASEKEI